MVALCLSVATSAVAKKPISRATCIGQDCAKCHTLSVKEATDILRPLNVTVQSVKSAPIQGMFEVLAQRADQLGVIYIDFAKKHIMQGVVVKIAGMEAISTHSKEPPQLQKTTVIDPKKVPLQHSLVLGNPNSSKRIIVFTDPDCPYCRTLHAELIKLEQQVPDLAIHIMLYPLPMHPKAYDKSRFLVASKDMLLLNKAFKGEDIPSPLAEEGKAEIEAIIGFANQQGMTGTPAMIMPDGTLVVGVRDVNALKKYLAVQ